LLPAGAIVDQASLTAFLYVHATKLPAEIATGADLALLSLGAAIAAIAVIRQILLAALFPMFRANLLLHMLPSTAHHFHLFRHGPALVCGVCCVLRVASGLLGCQAKPHEQTTQGNNTTNITQHPNHTKRLSIQCCMWCVLRVACRLRVVALPGETPQATNPRQQNNQHCTRPKPYETPVDSVLYVMCAVCCVSPPG
jgi:hypothetical protein